MSEELNQMQGIQQEAQSADQLAYEINFIKRQALENLLSASVQIGERLSSAKELVPHGQWSAWLKEKVDYSQSTADNLMRIYREYGDEQISLSGRSKSQTFANLTYSQAVALFALPEHQREEFVEQHDISDMTTKELKEAIAAQKAAETERDQAKSDIDEVRSQAEAARTKAAALQRELDSNRADFEEVSASVGKIKKQRDKAKAKSERLQKELEEATKRMQELTSAPAEISEEDRAAIEEEISKKYEDMISQLTIDAETAKQQTEKITAEKAALEAKAAQLANDRVVKIGILFEQVQNTMQDMKRLIDGCPSEQRDKLNGLIMKTLTDIFGEN